MERTSEESSPKITREVGVRLQTPSGEIPLIASLFYQEDDPYAVRCSFHVGADEPVEWIFARDLLGVGCEMPAGEGDVKIWPVDESSVRLNLKSPFGEASLAFNRTNLQEFLTATTNMVAYGDEGEGQAFGRQFDAEVAGEAFWRE